MELGGLTTGDGERGMGRVECASGFFRLLYKRLVSVLSNLEHWWDLIYPGCLGVAKNKKKLGSLKEHERIAVIQTRGKETIISS